MNFDLAFEVEASAELECVVGDYEAKLPGLGVRFRTEVASICSAITQHPYLWRSRSEGFRRVNLQGFPYYVAFVTVDQLVVVVAVAHAKRDSAYFKLRL